MHYLLDTNLCIDLMRGRATSAFARLRRLQPDAAGISTISLAELRYGAAKSARRQHHEALIAAFCAPLAIAEFDARASEVYGVTRARLEADGRPIGPLDMLIAAHALALGAILLSANVREFGRVSGLVVEDWQRPIT